MTESNFKTEFSQLLLRFSSGDNKTPDMPLRLTNQQILDAIHDVLRTTLNINLQNIDATALKTPANEIVITTPHAPDILRVDYNQNNTLKSRLSLGCINDDDFSKSKLGSLLNVTEEKSDTSVGDASINKFENSTNKDFENNNTNLNAVESTKDTVAKEQKALDERFKSQTSKMDITKNLTMYNIVDEAHKSTVKAMHKLENLKELLMPESRPVRRLSAIMSLPMKPQQSAQNQHKTSAAPGTGMSLLRSRRSMHQLSDDVPVTPTSRMSLLPQPNSTASAAAKKPAAPKTVTTKLAQSKSRSESTPMLAELYRTRRDQSAGTTAGTSQLAKSPVKNKNPKYAHVQSTIPKITSSVKRKT